jgi:cytoskeletal protein RodZ
LIILLVGSCAWWAFAWYSSSKETPETVSVEELIEDSPEVIDDNNVNDNSEQESQNNEQENSENEDKEESQEVEVNQLKPEELTIQVLNAGAPAGVAGSVTAKYKDANYKTNDATNAQNNHEGVVIYYAVDKKEGLTDVVEVLGDTYGTPKQEESDEVTKKYDADFVVVIGK